MPAEGAERSPLAFNAGAAPAALRNRPRRDQVTAPSARHAGTKQAVHLTRSRGDAEKDAEKTNPRTDLTEGAGFASSLESHGASGGRRAFATGIQCRRGTGRTPQ